MIDRIADQIFIVWQRSKKISIVAARDFVNTIIVNQKPNGAIYVCATDTNIPGLVPETKGVIRASAPFGGWRIEPLEGDPSKSRVSYMIELDLKGNIP